MCVERAGIVSWMQERVENNVFDSESQPCHAVLLVIIAGTSCSSDGGELSADDQRHAWHYTAFGWCLHPMCP